MSDDKATNVRSKRFERMVAIENAFEGRVPGRRPRDDEKELLLIRMDIARQHRYIESGKLRIISQRLWEFQAKQRAE